MKILFRLLTLYILFCGLAFTQNPQPPSGYVTPVAFSGLNAQGTFGYVDVDATGALYSMGSGPGLTNIPGFVNPVAPVALDPSGNWQYLSVDATGALKAGAALPTPGSTGLCLVSTGSSPGAYNWGSCSGTSSSNFSTLVADAANISGSTFTIGDATHATTFTTSGVGVINANKVNGAVVPTSASVLGSNASNQLISQTTISVTGLTVTSSLSLPANSISNGMLANAATTVNGQTCTLGSTCTVPEQVNTVNMASQAGFNLLTSTVNSVGLTVTPTNSATNQLTFEVTGSSYTGNAATSTKWATARSLAGNSVDGSANVSFANKFIVQGTTDAGLSGAQFLGALGTGILKNTTTTGVLSIAASSDVIGLFTGCSGTQYLGADGACHTAGTGTITGVTAGTGLSGGGSSGGVTVSLSTPVTAANGGTGVSNTASFTLGTANVNLATLGTGIVKNTITTGALTDAASSDVIGLFTACSGTQYLGADGSCHNPTGSPAGSQYDIQIQNPASSFGAIATHSADTGDIITANNGAAPTANHPGITDSSSSVGTSGYTLACTASNAIQDSAHTLHIPSTYTGGSITIPLSTAGSSYSGCFFHIYNDTSAVLQVLATSGDTFTFNSGNAPTGTKITQFPIPAGGDVTVNFGSTGIWTVKDLQFNGSQLATNCTGYISPTGSAAYPGTLAAPASLANDNASNVAGDHICILGGTYQFSSQLTVSGSGSAGKYIVWESYGDAPWTFQAQAALATNVSNRRLMNANSLSYRKWIGRGLGTVDGQYFATIALNMNGGSHMEWSGIETKNMATSGLSLVNYDYATVHNNTFWNIGANIRTCSITAWSITANTPTMTCNNNFQTNEVIYLSGFTISTFFNTTTVTITSATSTSFTGTWSTTHANGSGTETGIGQVNYTGAGSAISVNSQIPVDSYTGTHFFIYDNVIAGVYDSAPTGHTDGNGIILDSSANGPWVGGVQIENNAIYATGGRCITDNAINQGKISVLNNTCYYSGLDTTVGFASISITTSGSDVRNNVVVLPGTNGCTPTAGQCSYAFLNNGGATGLTGAGNVYNGGAGVSGTWTGVTLTNADPKLTNPPSITVPGNGYATIADPGFAGINLGNAFYPSLTGAAKGVASDPYTTAYNTAPAIAGDGLPLWYEDILGSPRGGSTSYDSGAYQATAAFTGFGYSRQTGAMRDQGDQSQIVSNVMAGLANLTTNTLNADSLTVNALGSVTTGTPSTATTGGTIPASATYFAKIFAFDGSGNHTARSSEVSQATGSGTATNTITWNWTAVPGAVNYQIWVGATSGSEANYFTSSSNVYVETVPYTSGTSGTIPANNTTGPAVLQGATTVSAPGQLSVPGLLISGLPATGGTGTTTTPQVYINSGTAPTTWSTSGTLFGMNAPSGFTGNIEDYHVNGGSSIFSVNYQGNLNAAGSVTLPGIAGASTYCLQISSAGAVTNTGAACGSGSGGDTITSPNSTLNVGGTSSATTLDLKGAAGQIMAGATPALTSTPTLGASGTLGSLTFGNATSGLLTIQPVTGALGTVTASLPANTGTIAETNLAQTFSANQTLTGHIVMNGHDVAIPLVCADSSGSGTAQSCTTSPSYTPAAGDSILYTTTTANTGTGLTVNVNALGAKSVAKWQGTTTLAANDILANKYVLLTYDGTNWEISTIGNAPSGGGGGNPTVTTETANFSAAFGSTPTVYEVTTAASGVVRCALPNTIPSSGQWIEVNNHSAYPVTCYPGTTSANGGAFGTVLIGGHAALIIPSGASTQIYSDGANYTSSLHPATAYGPMTRHFGYFRAVGTATATAVGMSLNADSGAATAVVGTGTDDSYLKYSTTATSASVNGWNTNPIFQSAQDMYIYDRILLQQTATERVWVGAACDGCTGTLTGADAPAVQLYAFRYSTNASDTNWMACTGNGTTTACSSTGVAPSSTTPVQLSIQVFDDIPTPAVEFDVNGVETNVLTANVAASGTIMDPDTFITTLTTSIESFQVSEASASQQGR